MLCSGLVMTGLAAFSESVLKRKKIKREPTVAKLWYLLQIPATTCLTLMKVVYQRVGDVGSLIMTSLQIHCRSCRFVTRGVVSAMLSDTITHSVSFPLTYFHLAISQMWCWSGGIAILIKLCLLQYPAIEINWVLCSVIMVHQDTSSSYRSVDCIRLWSCLVWLSVFRALLCLRFSWCYITFLLTSFSLPFSELSLVSWLTSILQCYGAVGWVMWPVKSFQKWPIMC